jgi:hypothetical protein
MKKIILIAVLLVLSLAGGAYANDIFVTKFADGAVGKEDAETYIKAIILTCNNNTSGSGSTDSLGENCHIVLTSGDEAIGTEDPVRLAFATSATEPTKVINYDELIKGGILFSSGAYFDEVTGETATSIIYRQTP